ncbi:MAG: hypothetical protein ACXAB7_08640 [Candidatus Kariarchaeaceae archaeon]
MMLYYRHHGCRRGGFSRVIFLSIIFVLIFGMRIPSNFSVLLFVMVVIVILSLRNQSHKHPTPYTRTPAYPNRSRYTPQKPVRPSAISKYQEQIMEHCVACGAGTRKNQNFCSECGTKIV